MNLNIKYFGLLAEISGCSEETMEFSKTTVSDLIETLFEKYPALKEKDFQVAQNLEITPKEMPITESEIALLPPFSGG
ncbi:MAG: MoaD/ThiS family protein [Flavobacteriaceae bacterium]|nr:MoaD/ThiS family protein [Flavobacteriaceae bacterium]